MKKLSLLALIALFLFSAALHAAVGRIAAMMGEVGIERNGKLITGTVGLGLETKDIILVGSRSRTQIIFADKTVISLGQKSRFTIDAYQQGANPKAEFGIVEGAFRTITGKIGKIAPDAFKVKTKVATIGIRGTQFMGEIGETEQIACTQGAITVETPNGMVDVSAGQITRLLPSAPPARPARYSRDEINILSEQVDDEGEILRIEEIPPTQMNPEADPEPAPAAPEEKATAEESAEGETETAETTGKIITLLEPDPIPQEPAVVEETTTVIATAVDDGTITQTIEEIADILGIDPENYTEEEFNRILQVIIDNDLAERILNGEIDLDSLNTIPATGSTIPTASYVLIDDVYASNVNYGFWLLSGASAEDYTVAQITGALVSGVKTPESVISNYISNSATASYSGSSIGVITSGGVSEQATGGVNLNIDFANVANPVSGDISLSSESFTTGLTVNSGTLAPSGFTLGFGNADGSGTGAFYGTGGQEIGGTFDATNIDGTGTSAFGAFVGAQ